VQYFQRAVFELHPENRPPYDVLLSHLGTFRYRTEYLQLNPTPAPPTAIPPTQQPLPTPTTPVTPPSRVIPQPPEYAAVRARFEYMTPEQWRAAGYTTTVPCTPGIGILTINQTLWDAQHDSGRLDPLNPPVLAVDRAGQRVLGLRWVASSDIQPPPVLFGQQMSVIVAGDPFYVLGSFFKPDGYVLFAHYDRVQCGR
jgi:hypothetical protein